MTLIHERDSNGQPLFDSNNNPLQVEQVPDENAEPTASDDTQEDDAPAPRRARTAPRPAAT